MSCMKKYTKIGSFSDEKQSCEYEGEEANTRQYGILNTYIQYESETWMLLDKRESIVRGVEINHMRNACVVDRRDRQTKEQVCDRCSIEVDVLWKIKSNTLRWFSQGFKKRMYEREVKGRRRKAR